MEIVQGSIEKLIWGAYGLLRDSNHGIILIPYVLPDEEVEVEITGKKRGVSWGKVIKIINPSKRRITPKCKFYGMCGGCNLQHTDTEFQKDLKLDMLEELIRRNFKGKIETTPVLQGDCWNYRQKVTYRASVNDEKTKLGLLEENSCNIVEIDNCMIIDEKINDIKDSIKDRIGNDVKGNIDLIRIMARCDENEVDYFSPDIEALKTDKTLNTIIRHSGKTFAYQYNARHFFQINPVMARRLTQQINAYLSAYEKDLLIDLHCGVGFFSIALAPFFRKVLGCDIDKENADQSSRNAIINGFNNVEYFNQSDIEFLRNQSCLDYACILLDPPRDGLDKNLLRQLLIKKPRQIIYVSCDPPSFLRDIEILIDIGYKCDIISTVDFFPQTDHLEIWSPLLLRDK